MPAGGLRTLRWQPRQGRAGAGQPGRSKQQVHWRRVGQTGENMQVVLHKIEGGTTSGRCEAHGTGERGGKRFLQGSVTQTQCSEIGRFGESRHTCTSPPFAFPLPPMVLPVPHRVRPLLPAHVHKGGHAGGEGVLKGGPPLLPPLAHWTPPVTADVRIVVPPRCHAGGAAAATATGWGPRQQSGAGMEGGLGEEWREAGGEAAGKPGHNRRAQLGSPRQGRAKHGIAQRYAMLRVGVVCS